MATGGLGRTRGAAAVTVLDHVLRYSACGEGVKGGVRSRVRAISSARGQWSEREVKSSSFSPAL